MTEQTAYQAAEKDEKTVLKNLNDDDFNLDEFELTDDNKCNFLCNCPWLQRFANKRFYLIVYSVSGLIFAMSNVYMKGVLTTLEKRFHIPSRNTGIISTGNDFSMIICAPLLSHILSKKHRPRWIGLVYIALACYCLAMANLHFIYGPGEEALQLTQEYGGDIRGNSSSAFSYYQKFLCQSNATVDDKCSAENREGDFMPQIYLFAINFALGIFSSYVDTLGTAYLDDNVEKSKSPTYLSISFFIRLIGPAIGYNLASFCLKFYIAPTLTPLITNTDTRWRGAWWVGWLFISMLSIIVAFGLVLFPKELPKTTERRKIMLLKRTNSTKEAKKKNKSFMASFRDLMSNKIFILNNVSGCFYVFGMMPYWTYTPKYIETQYRQSASFSNFLTGSVALVFTAVGTLGAGYLIEKLKPSARKMALWNCFVGLLVGFGMVAYIFLGCSANDSAVSINNINAVGATDSCTMNCYCDFVKFSPVCGENGNIYISPCHAGCSGMARLENGTKIYENCSCVSKPQNDTEIEVRSINGGGGSATEGFCPVNCDRALFYFILIFCVGKFFGASGRSSNVLLSIRCVKPEDKEFSFGIGMMMLSIFAFMPSPILFGWIIDKSCLFWGKTCSSKGNCWLYDNEAMRYNLNAIAAFATFIGVLLDGGVWYLVKDLQIFDNDEEEVKAEMNVLKMRRQQSQLSQKSQKSIDNNSIQ